MRNTNKYADLSYSAQQNKKKVKLVLHQDNDFRLLQLCERFTSISDYFSASRKPIFDLISVFEKITNTLYRYFR
jgi:hypothetical protein